ncbi:DUF1822 family protein [Oscillatoriales cyanobacterium LEGE 11467]|uniref:DUF1822 family protein n=1 Tax=Zarconia navalis LEGE 11467 TaxID=1828826 RepID=A0A928W0L4_9CYAN|nr:DUF1822 family protein [Zarconia navalis]MBE9042302.1 DUF1822 family protein [Zarconia navalis LEGE 11467]
MAKKKSRTPKSLTFTVPLGQEAHQMADRFRQRQFSLKQGKQVYLNTLAVYAVNFYLQCMGFDTDKSNSESYDRAIQTFLDVADLAIKEVGTFECRPVLPDEEILRVPQEVWQDRKGYFAVQFDRALKKAKLIGFVRQVRTEEIPLSQLRSLDGFLRYASQLQNSVKLNQWLNDIFDTGWDAVESLLSPPQMAWRGSQNRGFALRGSPTQIERVKRLTLARSGEEVALLVRLKPRTDREMGIGVEIYPTGDRTYLPQDLQLMVLDEAGAAVMQAEARSTKNIQLKFSGETGEEFSIKVALGDTSVTEAFLI